MTSLTDIFIKLMAKGLKSHEHNKFRFKVDSDGTLRGLIAELHEEFGERFEVYLEDKYERKLRRDAIVLVNGMNMVAHEGLDTVLSQDDLVVFMIATTGG